MVFTQAAPQQSRRNGFPNVVKQTHVTKAGQSHKQCNYAEESLLKSRGAIQKETKIFTDYEQLQGEVTT